MSDKAKQPKHGLNNPKTRLSAPCPTARGKQSTLGWDIWNNNPRVVVNTGDPNLANPSSQYGRITAAMEPPSFYALLEMIRTVANATEEVRYEFKLFALGRNAQRGDQPRHASSIWVGRGADGEVFLSVVKKEDADGWPVIKFPFAPPDSRFVKIHKQDGSEFSKAELSTKLAIAYANMLENMMGTLLITNYVEPEPFIPGNRGGGGGYGNRGGGGGGYNGGGGNSGGGSGGIDDSGDLPF